VYAVDLGGFERRTISVDFHPKLQNLLHQS
ncbi:hypothetical protein Gorai_022610, partial [Gossypium raimondii]|nr:hypothetical protein [Gossypium raimondii]